MHKRIIAAAIVLMLVFTLSAKISVMSSSESHLSLEYKLSDYEISEITINSEVYQRILSNGLGSMQAGNPDLPSSAVWITLPRGMEAGITSNNEMLETLKVDLLAPVPQPAPEMKDAGDPEFIFNDDIYDSNKLFPGYSAGIENESVYRGQPCALVRFYPFQYNPVSGELQVSSVINVDIDFSGSAEAIPENINFENLRNHLSSFTINAEEVLDYQESLPSNREDFRNDGGELLIFAPDIFLEAAENLANWKERKGIKTKVVPLAESGDTPFEISSYINYCYENCIPAPEYIMLFGDAEFISPWYVHLDTYSNTMLGTDVYYGDLEMEFDYVLDFAVGRLPVDTFEDAQRMVENIINYESNPPTQASFYSDAAIAGAFQDGASGDPPDMYANRRFAKTSEDMRNFLYSENYNPQRLYAEYNGYSGGEIFPTYWNQNYYIFENDTPGGELAEEIQKPQFPWDFNDNDVTNALNDGTFILTHRDHGGRTGWGEPDYGNSDVLNLTNGENLPVVWSVNCLTGYFDNETDDPASGTGENAECFVEQWFRNPDGGAIGAVGSTRVSYSGNNDRFVWGLMDAIWPSFLDWCGADYPANNAIYRMGDVVNYGKTYLAANVFLDDYLLITFEEFEWFGDPTLEIWTAQPQMLMVSHEPSFEYGSEFFSVDAGITGARCTLWNGEEVVAEGVTGLDFIAALNVSGIAYTNELTLTVSYPQTQPYITDIDVIPPANGVLQLEYIVINDALENENGQADFGETVSLGLILENIGGEAITEFDMELSLESDYVTLNSSEYSFSGNIAPQQSTEVSDMFTLEIADDCPDLEEVELFFSSSEYSFSTSLDLHAPVLSCNYFRVEDEDGNNNGAADPGETVQLILPVANTGSIVSELISIMLLSYDPSLTIITGEVFIDTLGADIIELYFTAEIAESAPVDTDYQVQAFLNSGAYSYDRLMTGNFGLAIEDFESGNFNQFNWQINGTVGWMIDDDAASGLYSARTEMMGVNNWTELEISGFLPEDDVISFYRKLYADTSLPNNNGGMLYFLIDNEEIGAWGANRPWQRMEYNVPAGPHTFRWLFEKDTDPTLGEDGAWVDRIELPNMSPPPPPNLEYDVSEINISVESGTIEESEIGLTNSGAGTVEYFLYFDEETRDLADSRLVINSYQYYPGQTTGWLLELENNSTSGEDITDLDLEFPECVTVNVTTPLTGGSGGIMTSDGTTGSGVTVNWHGEYPEGEGFLLPGESAVGAVNVSIGNEAPLNFSLNATISGDMGSVIEHSIQLGNLSNGWLTLSHNNGMLIYGQYEGIGLTFNAENLETGIYEQDLLLLDDMGNQTIIPVTMEVTASSSEENAVQLTTAINSLYPNPFNPQTTLEYSVKQEEFIDISVYNLKGQKVDTIISKIVSSGKHQVVWNANTQPSGIYFFKLKSESCNQTKKVLLLK